MSSPRLPDILGTLDRLTATRALTDQVEKVCQEEGLPVTRPQIEAAAQAQWDQSVTPQNLPMFAKFKTRAAWEREQIRQKQRSKWSGRLFWFGTPPVFVVWGVALSLIGNAPAWSGSWLLMWTLQLLFFVTLSAGNVWVVAGRKGDELTPEIIAPLRLQRWSRSARVAQVHQALLAIPFPLLPDDAKILDRWAEEDELAAGCPSSPLPHTSNQP